MPKIISSQSKFIRSLLEKTPLTVLDIETSGWLEKVLAGGTTHKGAVLEVGALQTFGLGKPISEYQAFVDPRGQGIKISSEWTKEYSKSKAFTQLHGIASPFPGFQGKIAKVGEVQKKLSAMFPAQGKGLLLGYGIKKFDIPFLRERGIWSPGVSQQAQIVDVWEMAKRSFPKLKRHDLPTVATALGIKVPTGLHRSLTDSYLTLEVFNKLSSGRYARRSGIGEIVKAVHGVTSLEQIKKQEYWDQVNQEYWRSREAAGLPRWGGVGGPGKVAPSDIGTNYPGTVRSIRSIETDEGRRLAHMPEESFREMQQASVNDVLQDILSSSAQELKDYEKMRAIEESAFFGEHTPETLKLTRKRAKFWEQVSPRSMRKGFITERLGFTEAQESILRSGKFAKGGLRKQFALKMSAFEMMGHLPRSEYLGQLPASAETRVVGFGEYSREPGAFFSAMYPGGKSSFIRLEQQESLINEMFGITKTYRMVGTGKLVTPEQMAHIKVMAPSQDMAALRKLASKEKIRKYIERGIEREIPLSQRELKTGWIDPEKATIVDKYAYSVGKPGRRKAPPTIEEESDVFARVTREAIEGSWGKVSAPDLNVEQGIGAAEGMVTPEVDPWSLTGESTSGLEAIRDEAKSAHVEISDASVASIENARWHTRELGRLKKYQEQAFLYKWVKKKGQSKKTRKFKGFTAKFEQASIAGRALFLSRELDLTGKTPEEIEIALENLRPGSNIKVQEEGKWRTIAAEDAKLANIYLQDAAETSARLFSSLENPIPVRAQAEQVFEIYFKKIKAGKGKRIFGGYTAAGTYLGKVSEKYSGDPNLTRGYAKIFEGKHKYGLGWAPTEAPFRWSRFGATEIAENEERAKAGLAPKQEISGLLDIEPGYRLQEESMVQENLKKIYEQSGEDYKLVSKYKLDRTANTYVDIETGKAVDQTVAQVYQNKVTAVYEKQAKARARMARMKIKTGNVAGKMDEVLTGKTFAGKGKDLLFGALALSAALVSLTAFSSKKRITSPSDISRQPYGSTTDDQRMFENRPISRAPARVVPEYSGRQEYTTNIDVYATDPGGIDHRDLSRVMDRHARNTLGVSKGSVSMEINDNSDNSSDRSRKRQYQSMLRS